MNATRSAEPRPGPDADDLGRLIDRLVDGELPEADRRALLGRLDAVAGEAGWRRCALAFLEAREWADALATPAGRSASDGPAPGPAAVIGAVRPSSASPARSALRGLSMAAALAGAFLLGRLGGVVPAPSPGAPALPAVPAAVEVAAGPRDAAEPDGAASADLSDEELLALDGRSTADPWAEPDDYWRPSPTATVRGGATPWAWSNTPAPAAVPELPAPVVEDWRRRGYEVETRPRFVSVGDDSGRSGPVPVNEVRLRYVGDRTY